MLREWKDQHVATRKELQQHDAGCLHRKSRSAPPFPGEEIRVPAGERCWRCGYPSMLLQFHLWQHHAHFLWRRHQHRRGSKEYLWPGFWWCKCRISKARSGLHRSFHDLYNLLAVALWWKKWWLCPRHLWLPVSPTPTAQEMYQDPGSRSQSLSEELPWGSKVLGKERSVGPSAKFEDYQVWS